MVEADDLALGRQDERGVRKVTSNGDVSNSVYCEFGRYEASIDGLWAVPYFRLANVWKLVAPNFDDAIEALIADWLGSDVVSIGTLLNTGRAQQFGVHPRAGVPAVEWHPLASSDVQVLAY